MKTFIFITFIAIIFSIVSFYNLPTRKLWNLMGEYSVLVMLGITLLVLVICFALFEALQPWGNFIIYF